jgi:hypothetical protein
VHDGVENRRTNIVGGISIGSKGESTPQKRFGKPELILKKPPPPGAAGLEPKPFGSRRRALMEIKPLVSTSRFLDDSVRGNQSQFDFESVNLRELSSS